MSQDSYYRSAYVKMCQKRNNDRKELIERIKKADLFVAYLCIRHLDAMVGSRMAYRDGLMDAFSTVYGQEEADRLWEYLDKRRERMTRLINHMLKVKMGRGELR